MLNRVEMLLTDKQKMHCNVLKVLYLANIPAPYSVDFYNELGKLSDLTVVYERKLSKDRNASWFTSRAMFFKSIFLSGIKVGNEAAFCPSVIKYLLNKKFDVVVVSGYSTPTGILSILAMKAIRRKFFIHCDGGMSKTCNGLKEKFKKYLISGAAGWFSSGKITDEYLLHYGARKDKIIFYPFTSLVNEDILKQPITHEEKMRLRAKLGITESKVILSVGSFIFRKGYDVLLNACSPQRSNVGIYIVGGQATEEYTHLAEKLKLMNVHFIEFKHKNELKEYYCAADLFVLPTRDDIWGLVINEAMANALPIITTDKCVAGLELVQDDNGAIIPSDDSDALRKAMDAILDNEELCRKMGEKSLEKIRSYTIENMTATYMVGLEKMK